MQYVFDEINKETLLKLYSEFGFTSRKIGDIVGVTEDAVLKRLKQYSISSDSRNNFNSDIEVIFTGVKKDIKKNLTDDILLSLNLEGKTDREIGGMYGLTGEGIAYRRKKLGIGVSMKASDLFKLNIPNIPKDNLEKDYYNLTQEEFSDKYKVSKTTWRPALKDAGIEGKMDHRISQYPPLTLDQRTLIIGGLLGDGGIDEVCRYYESHSLKQEQYLRFKMKVMEPYTSNIYSVDKGTGLRFTTVQHPVFTEFRDVFYQEGVEGKLIPLDYIAKNWDDRILAYWFIDDGYYDDEDRFVVINNFCPIKGQLSEFSNFLEIKYGWGFQLYKSGISFSKRYYKDFFDIVFKVATPDVLYKVPEEFLRQDMIPEDIPVVIHPKFYRVGNDVIKVRMFEKLFKQYWGKPFPYSDISESRAIYIVNNFKNGPIIRCVDDTLGHSSAGMDLCDRFFPNIYECRRKGYVSPVEAWGDETFFRKLLDNRFKYADRINDASMRKGFKLMNMVTGNFKPTVARYIYKNYCDNGKILDYCAGFGSRMLAAMSLGFEYVGYEPNTKTYDNLIKFGNFIKTNIGGDYNIIKQGSEIGVSRVGYFGLAFSSPPYFDYEIYSSEDSQSIVRFPELSDWLENYWDMTIKNCYDSLHAKGIFGVCLSPNQKVPLIERTIQTCKKFGLYFFKAIKVPFKHVVTSDSYEVILLFSKAIQNVPIPEFVYGKSVTNGEIVFKADEEESEVIVKKRNFPVNFNPAFIQAAFKEISEKMGTSRDTYKDPKLLGVPSHVLEHYYGSWNNFVLACGVGPGYIAKSSVERVREYLSACLSRGEVLSFYNYEKNTGHPSTRLKRLFNIGRPYAYLKDRLFEVALDPSKHEDFLKNFDQ